MILSRLTSAVREQNWAAVTIEFVIVLSGVIIGFQATAWNEARQDAERESLIISRLQADFIAIEADVTTVIADLERRSEAAGGFIPMIRDDSVDVHSETFRLGLANTIGTPVPAGRSATYVDLLESGDMALIRSEDLRRALIEFDEQVRRHEMAYQTLATLVIDNTRVLLEYQSLLRAVGDDPASYAEAIEVTRQSADLISSAQLMQTVSQTNLAWHQGRYETARNVVAALNAEAN